jgi:uncharacterized protein (DUF924 family)
MIAAIILFDQFPRNAFRLDLRSFSFDSRALEVSKKFIRRDDRVEVHPIIESFAYMVKTSPFLKPFEHSESIEDQVQGVELFDQLLSRTSNTEAKV